MRRFLDWLDDLSIAREVRKRDRSDTGERMTLDELIRAQGYDPADFQGGDGNKEPAVPDSGRHPERTPERGL